MPIPYSIDNGEILVRFVFLDNFKNKKLESDKINSQEIFLDTRLLGVSLQRELILSFVKKEPRVSQTKHTLVL
jgi:hypothetical protein